MRLRVIRVQRTFIGLGLLVFTAWSIPIRAQALFHLHVGDDVSSSVLSTRAPKYKESYKEYWVMKWTLDNGNDLSMTMTEEGKLVYLESDWNGKSTETSCDLAWLKFGDTTLSDIRKRFGSNGFGFEQRPRLIVDAPDASS